jgi:NAD(P)-dependent dehydrogenase (short-subunit alcohol dehydrogenase family)/pimeloyl-ACP methyl ester carboxylesterase
MVDMGSPDTEAADSPRTRWVRTPDGLRLSVAELGDPARPTVVLLHGYPDSKEVWSLVAARLAPHFHVVTYDVRGHGESDAPRPLRGGFTLAALTDDFLAVIDAVSPGAPVHLVGHDWGSVQGWEFASVTRTRGRIASFTTMSGPSLDHFGHWLKRRTHRPTPAHLAQLLGQGAKSWYVYLFHTPLLPELAWRGPVGAAWPAVLRRLEKTPEDGYPTASLRSDAARGVWLYRDNVRARLAHPRADAHAHVPVQLIHPTGDAFISARLFDELEQWTPSLVRRTLPAKHWAPRTRPDQLAVWIKQFIESTGTGTHRTDTHTHTDTAVDIEAVGPAALPAGPWAERFAGSLVLVTGAASGIGEATALAFAEAGARVIAVDRDADGAARTAGAARQRGATDAWAHTTDVSDEAAMEKLAATVAGAHGTVDILVNNAGVGLAGHFLDTTTEEWRRVLDVNLWGVIHGCRLFGKQMAERGQGGHIVNVASAAAFQPARALPAYATSKAAVLMLSECLRAELAGQAIGVTAVCPGIVTTNITATTRFAGTDAEEERRRQQDATRAYRLRNYPPEKVAAAILKAVADNRAVVPVTPEARAGRALGRVAPRAVRALARLSPPTPKPKPKPRRGPTDKPKPDAG